MSCVGDRRHGLACVGSYSVFKIKAEQRLCSLLPFCSVCDPAHRDTQGRAVYGTRVLALSSSQVKSQDT